MAMKVKHSAIIEKYVLYHIYNFTELQYTGRGEIRKNQMCARCRNHDEDRPLRGHKNKCPYTRCECAKCFITVERRKIMAKQIKDYRVNKIDEPVANDSSSETQHSSHGSSSVSLPKLTPTEVIEVDESSDGYESLDSPPLDIQNTFFMAQSLYEKFCLGGVEEQMQLVYAFLSVVNKNWTAMNRSLGQGNLTLTYVVKRVWKW
jgi:DM DNA binding domain